jgi:TfoX/Sxy family transcriptional regulator of competence genes
MFPQTDDRLVSRSASEVPVPSAGSPHSPGWAKSPADLVDRFEAGTAPFMSEPGVERRKMFGYPACFVDGKMFTGLHQDSWIVRLGPDDLGRLTELGGSAFEPMAGRPMTGFLRLPAELAEPNAAQPWLERALAHARTLEKKKR